MATSAIFCPLCSQADMIVRVTSPQAPRVLPITDAELAQVAQQFNPAPVASVPAGTAPTTGRRSGCLVAALIVFGIFLFAAGSIYGVYQPACPAGELIKNYPVSGLPMFEPHCLSGDVLYEPERDYIYPGAAIISPAMQWGGAGLFLWGCILPLFRWFQGRSEREQARIRGQRQTATSQRAISQQNIMAQVNRARGRVDSAYYCGRDDGFFIPGYPQFFHRRDWLHFLFG